MTTASTTARRALTVIATCATMVLVGAGTAMADSPVGSDWPAGDPKSHLENLVLFGGGTVGLFVLVALFGLLTARNNYVPPPPSQELATRPSDDVASH